MTANIGPKRLVVGAHYGLTEWLAQRITAVIITVYAVALALWVQAFGEPGYEGWAGLFAPQWMKVVTLIVLAAVFYHAWIGVRDIWMDYIKPTGLRLTLQVLTVLWLAGCAVWSVQILWIV